jgi:hypothetical protein
LEGIIEQLRDILNGARPQDSQKFREVGMAHVPSVMLTSVEGPHMAKGEKFGFFQFGGSDIIVLVQEGVDLRLPRGRWR